MKDHLHLCLDFFFSLFLEGREEEGREERNYGVNKEGNGKVKKILPR